MLIEDLKPGEEKTCLIQSNTNIEGISIFLFVNPKCQKKKKISKYRKKSQANYFWFQGLC